MGDVAGILRQFRELSRSGRFERRITRSSRRRDDQGFQGGVEMPYEIRGRGRVDAGTRWPHRRL